MKDASDDRNDELQLDAGFRASCAALARFIERGLAAQRAVDGLGAGKPPKPKRGVSKNASKSADKPERSK